jgi:hypothetical protein
MTQETYNLVSLIATFVGFSLTIIGFLFTISYIRLLIRQMSSSIRNREAEFFVKLYEMSSTVPLHSDFDVVWKMMPENISAEKTQESCLRACLFFEMVGSVVDREYVSTELISDYFGSLITGCYDKMRPYIDHERRKPYNDKFAFKFEKVAAKMRSMDHVSLTPGEHPTLRPPTPPPVSAY